MTGRPDYYDASYPPSLWGGGPGAIVWEDKTADWVTAGGPDGSTFADLAALKADATYGDNTWVQQTWLPGEYIVLGDSSAARWDNPTWVAVSPPPPPPPPPPPMDDPPDGSCTKAEIQAWLDRHGVAWSTAMSKAELLDLVAGSGAG